MPEQYQADFDAFGESHVALHKKLRKTGYLDEHGQPMRSEGVLSSAVTAISPGDDLKIAWTIDIQPGAGSKSSMRIAMADRSASASETSAQQWNTVAGDVLPESVVNAGRRLLERVGAHQQGDLDEFREASSTRRDVREVVLSKSDDGRWDRRVWVSKRGVYYEATEVIVAGIYEVRCRLIVDQRSINGKASRYPQIVELHWRPTIGE